MKTAPSTKVIVSRAVRRPLDEVRDAAGRIGRLLEHDDVASLDVADSVAELVDEHAVVDVERVGHRFRRDVERLEEEGLDEEGDGERTDRNRHPFDQRSQ